MNKKSIKDLIIEHKNLKKNSQVANDAFENKINKKNLKTFFIVPPKWTKRYY